MRSVDDRRRLTYAESGVDIDLKSQGISSLVKKLGPGRKGRWRQMRLAGHFAGMIDFGDYALTLCTDGVGTKLLVAESLGIWNTVGIDCIAMNVNDTICVGAEPVAFVDYMAVDRPVPEILADIGEGLQRGAELANVDIVGGELAVMPEVVRGLDLTGTCLGIVRKSHIITGEACRPGDAIIGLPSSGVHSNGLTLARKIVERSGLQYGDFINRLGRSIGEELLEPTTIYVRQVLEIARRFKIHGLVNITGGGLRNFLRLKEGLGYRIDRPMRPQLIFGLLQEYGAVDRKEMYQTFNMGLGFAVIVSRRSAAPVRSALGRGAQIIGEVDDGGTVSVPSLDIEYDRY